MPRTLGPQLQQSYGASEFHTAPQIQHAIAKLRLDPKIMTFGYAAFLPQEIFDAMAEEMPVRMRYEEVRETFERFVPSVPTSSSGNAEVNICMLSRGVPPNLGPTNAFDDICS